jgi:hypothetical protein
MFFWQTTGIAAVCVYLLVAAIVLFNLCSFDNFSNTPPEHTCVEYITHYIMCTVCSIIWLPLLVFILIADWIDNNKIKKLNINSST